MSVCGSAPRPVFVFEPKVSWPFHRPNLQGSPSIDFKGEPFCICMGHHVEVRGKYEITSGSDGHHHHDDCHLTPEPGDDDEYGQQHGAVTVHDGKLVLTVSMLSKGTAVQLAPGAELRHPLCLGRHVPLLPSAVLSTRLPQPVISGFCPGTDSPAW